MTKWLHTRVRTLLLSTLATVGLCVVTVASPASAAPITLTFSTPGSTTWTVPAGVHQISLDVWGAQGGRANRGMGGGLGGRTQATLSVSPGDVLQINVGGAGGDSPPGIGVSGAGGVHGGGAGGSGFSAQPQATVFGGGGGGGASDVRRAPYGLNDRLVVGAGGGGGSLGCAGGDGGGIIGNFSTANGGAMCAWTGGPGLSSAGGAGGPHGNLTGSDGSAGTAGGGGRGGVGDDVGGEPVGGGGGGGGWYGGGGGGGGTHIPNTGAASIGGGGGGGGSSHADSSVSDLVLTSGARTGNGLVTITYAAPPVAVDDAYTRPANSPLTVAARGVLANDTGAASAQLVSGPTRGTVTLNGDGSFTYSPSGSDAPDVFGFFRDDSFTYKALGDQSSESNVATVTISVVPPSPVAVNDAYTALENTPLTEPDIFGVLANDSNAGRAALASGPAHGTLSLNVKGGFTYTPATGFTGTDSFSYDAFYSQFPPATGENIPSSRATVALTVVAPPTAAADAYTTPEDSVLIVDTPGVLANDTGGMFASQASGPAHGSLVLSADGSFVYTPASGFFGSDSFTYTAVNAQQMDSNIATVTISVLAPAPVAVDDSYATLENTALTEPASHGVLANDSQAVGAVLVSGPAHGTLSLNGNGGFTYTPADGFTGADSFSYAASNVQNVLSSAATVTIHVTRPRPTDPGGGPGGGPNPGATPELDTLILFGVGLSGLATFWRRRRRTSW